MKTKFILPRFEWRYVAPMCVVLSIIIAFCWYFNGRVDKATFWMVAAVMNCILHKL